MKGTISGDYPTSIIFQAIQRIESSEAGEVSFEIGESIPDNSFDFNLQSVSSIVSMIGVALAAMQLMVSIIAERSKRHEPIGAEMEEEANSKTKELSSSKDYRVAHRLRRISPEQLEITTVVDSRVQIQRLEIISNVFIDRQQFSANIRPLKRGNSKGTDSIEQIEGGADATMLRQLLLTRFNLEELRTLCTDLKVNYSDLGGEGQEAKARELIAFLQRRKRLGELVIYIRQLRPDINF
jgi:hypothetical protein